MDLRFKIVGGDVKAEQPYIVIQPRPLWVRSVVLREGLSLVIALPLRLWPRALAHLACAVFGRWEN